MQEHRQECMQERLNIAIDGPAGAGKSTVAKNVAARLGIKYLDTGAMYRALALYAQGQGVAVDDEKAVEHILSGADISVRYTEAGQRILLFSEDVTDSLRANELSMAASTVSAHRAVRLHMTELQRRVAREYDVVMDGRDIGTNVLVHTKYKFFLIADVEERARRRMGELKRRGVETGSLEQLAADIARRDYNDSHRAFMPLRRAEDARLIDTTHLTVDEVTEQILSFVRGRGDGCCTSSERS